MCPLKREQATRVSYNTLTHSRLYCRDRSWKSRSWITGYYQVPFGTIQYKVNKQIATKLIKGESLIDADCWQH